MRAEGHGKLMTLVLTPGHRHEAPVFPLLMAQGAVKRTGHGRPKRYPRRVVGDKGYSPRNAPARLPAAWSSGVTIPRKRQRVPERPL